MTEMTKKTKKAKEASHLKQACLLAVEASGTSASLALVTGDAVLGVAKRDETHAHAPHMTMLLKQCLAEAGVEASTITHVAAGCGPGSFTGIRTGLALAKGVALALDVPIYGVSSLTALLVEASESNMPILVAVDSRRGGYFGCLYGEDRRAMTPVFEVDSAVLIAQGCKKMPGEMLGEMPIKSMPMTILGHDAEILAKTLQNEGFAIAKAIKTDPNALAVGCYVRNLIKNGEGAEGYPAHAHYHRGASLGGKKQAD